MPLRGRPCLICDRRSPPGQVLAAFAAVYVLWGSTYLGIRFSIETLPLPDAGRALRPRRRGLYALAKYRRPSAHAPRGDVRASAADFSFSRDGSVVWAEHFIPSGVAALIVATEPISFVLMEAMRRRRMPRALVFAGLALGLAGLAILVGPGSILGSERFHLGAAGVLVLGTFAWAGGSLFSRGSRLPASPVMATATTLLCGGALLAGLGLAAGELSRSTAAGRPLVLETIYLFLFG